MRKTVLLVSYFAPPLLNAESILVWKTVCELSNHFDVKLLTSALSDSSRVDPKMTLPSSVHLYRKPIFKPKTPVFRKLTDKAIGLVSDEQYLWAMFGRLESIDFDLIYSRSHPGASHIFAHKLKQQTQKPWIAQFSDPWTRNPYHTNHTAIRKMADLHWEQKVVRDADFLVFPTKEILNIYDDAYKTVNIKKKSLILPHHYIPALYGQTALGQASPRASNVSFAYYGDFYGVRSPAPFIEALRQLAVTHPNLTNHVTVEFYGNIESKFNEIVESSPVKIHRRLVTYFESLKQMTQSDVLLLIDAPSDNGINPFLPSKLIDYLGAGKKILGITDEKGTTADILRKHGHYVANPHNLQVIMDAVKTCITISHSSIEAPAEFTTKHVVGRLVDVMNELTNSR